MDRLTNQQIERRFQTRRASDPDALISDNNRIKGTMPWVPRYVDLTTIIEHALDWESKLDEIGKFSR